MTDLSEFEVIHQHKAECNYKVKNKKKKAVISTLNYQRQRATFSNGAQN